MQQAFVAFPGDGISGLREIKNYSAIFDNHGIPRAREELLHFAYKGFRRHQGILSAIGSHVCDE
jgi:hypothetical protein